LLETGERIKRAASFIAVMLILGCASSALAKYWAPHLFEMVGGAELIVAGRIESVGAQTYVLNVERVLAGDYQQRSIEICRFQDWACSWRYAPYEAGQRLVAFIQKDDAASRQNGRTVFRTMSAGREGEFPIEGDFAYCFLVWPIPESNRARIGKHDYVFKTSIDNLYSAIEGYRSLYHVELGSGRLEKVGPHDDYLLAARIARRQPTIDRSEAPFRPRQMLPTPLARLETYSGRSFLHHFLIDSTERIALHLGSAGVGWKLPADDATPELQVVRYQPHESARSSNGSDASARRK
jgi:hypothetical protein